MAVAGTRPWLDTPVNTAFVKFVVVTSLFAKEAPVKLAPERSHPRKLIPDKSTDDERSADCAMAVGPSRNPPLPRTAHIPAPVGIVGNTVPCIAGLPPVIPPPVEITLVNVAPVKFAPLISAPVNTAFVRLAPVRLARAILKPVSVMPDQSAERRRTPGPTMKPFRVKYAEDCGGVAGNVASPELRNSPVVIFVRFVVVVNIAPLISAPVKVAPDKSTPSKFAPTRDTPGPTIIPFPTALPRTDVAAFGIVAVPGDPAAPFKSPPLRSPVIVALAKFAPDISHPVITRSVRSVPERLAPTNFTSGPTIQPTEPPPPRATYESDGSVAVVSPIIFPVRMPVMVAPDRLAVVSVAFRRTAFVKYAPVKSVLVRTMPDISTPDKSAPVSETPAPIRNPDPVPAPPPPVYRTT